MWPFPVPLPAPTTVLMEQLRWDLPPVTAGNPPLQSPKGSAPPSLRAAEPGTRPHTSSTIPRTTAGWAPTRGKRGFPCFKGETHVPGDSMRHTQEKYLCD